jgi:hypothetical protein
MPHLDPVTDAPEFTGPSRDWAAITAKEPVYRQERFNIRPQRMPISFKMTERPKVTTKPVVTINPSRVPILIRSSNNRPSEAGEGVSGSTWGVSDPGQYDARTLAGVGADPAVAADPLAQSPYAIDDNLRVKLVIAAGMGLVMAYLLYKDSRKK